MYRLASVVLTSAVLALVCTMTTEASSDETIPCVKDWGGPQHNKSALKSCEDWSAWQDYTQEKGWPIVFPLLMALGGLMVWPFVYCARYCCGCCGGHKMRPDNCCCGGSHWDQETEEYRMAQYGNADLKCAKIFPIIIFVIFIVAIAGAIPGSAHTVKGIDALGEGILGRIAWARNLLSDFCDATVNEATGKQLMSLSNFSDVTETLDRFEHDWKEEKTQNWVNFAKRLAWQLSQITAAPGIFVLLTVICAFAHVRTCLPCVNTCFFFLYLFIFGMIGFLLLALHLPMKVACNEAHLQLERKPGFMQWYVVPLCVKDNHFAKAREDVDNNLNDYSSRACNDIKGFCGDRDSNNASQVFTCDWKLLSSGGTCDNFDQVSRFANSMQVRAANDPADICSGQTNCTLCVCGEHCSDLQLRQDASRACEAVGNAKTLEDAWNTHLRPVLTCNKLYDQLMLIFTPACENLPHGVHLLGIGYTVICVVAIMAICMNFRGQKRWFKKPEGYVTRHDMDAHMLQEQHNPYDTNPQHVGAGGQPYVQSPHVQEQQYDPYGGVDAKGPAPEPVPLNSAMEGESYNQEKESAPVPVDNMV